MIDEVLHNTNGRWDLDGAGVSLFTYVSLLGSGFNDSFLVFLLQVAIPIILIFYYTSPDRDEDIAVGTRHMLFAVLVYYLYKLNRGESTIQISVIAQRFLMNYFLAKRSMDKFQPRRWNFRKRQL